VGRALESSSRSRSKRRLSWSNKEEDYVLASLAQAPTCLYQRVYFKHARKPPVGILMAWPSSTRCCDPSEAATGVNSRDERHDPRTRRAGGTDQRGDVPNSRRVSSPRPQIRDSTPHGNDPGPRPTYPVRCPDPVCDLVSVPCSLVSGVRAACRVALGRRSAREMRVGERFPATY